MKRVINIVNQKGGVGKTTTAINLSACLAESGYDTLLIDLDPQGNATSGIGCATDDGMKTIYEVLLGDCLLSEAIQPTGVPKLDIVPSHIKLIAAELELVSEMKREARLKEALGRLDRDYDFVIIDSAPSLGLLTVNSLTATNTVLVPIQCEYYALEGITQLLQTIHRVKNSLNPDLHLEGVLLTMYDVRTNLSQAVVDEVRRHFKDKVFSAIIPRNVALSEAPGFAKPITAYDPVCKGAEAYTQLAKEVIARD